MKFLIVSEEWLFMGTNYITLVPWMVQVIPRSQNSKKNSRWGSKHLLGSLLAHVFNSVCFPAFPASGYVRPVRPPLSTVLVERPHCQTRFSRAGILLSSLVQRSYHVTILGFAGIGSLFFVQLSVSSHWNRSTT